jgi:hypothetical protein
MDPFSNPHRHLPFDDVNSPKDQQQPAFMNNAGIGMTTPLPSPSLPAMPHPLSDYWRSPVAMETPQASSSSSASASGHQLLPNLNVNGSGGNYSNTFPKNLLGHQQQQQQHQPFSSILQPSTIPNASFPNFHHHSHNNHHQQQHNQLQHQQLQQKPFYTTYGSLPYGMENYSADANSMPTPPQQLLNTGGVPIGGGTDGKKVAGGKSSSSLSAAKKARSTPGQAREFACLFPDCGKKFKRSEHLKRHQRYLLLIIINVCAFSNTNRVMSCVCA